MVAEAKIKKLRDNKNWSQDYMAEVLGMSQPAYSKLESGQTKLTVERANQLAKVFDVEPEYFFTSDATFIHYGKDHSYGPIQYNTNNGMEDTYKELYQTIIEEKNQRIEQFEQENLFLKNELSKLVSKLAEKI